MGATGRLHLSFDGDILDNIGTASTTIKVYFGGTLVLNGTLTNGPNAVPDTVRGFVDITNLGVTNSQYVSGYWLQGQGGGNAVMTNLAAGIQQIGEYTGLAIDTTQAQSLTVTVTEGTASTNLEYRSFAVILELM
jgi:hypothetical protein